MPDNSESKRAAQAQDQTRAATRSAAQGTGETAQRNSAVMEQVGRRGTETLRRNSEAGAETMHHLGEVTGGALYRGTQAMAERQHQLAQSAAEQFEETARTLAQVVQEGTQDMRMLMTLPGTARGGLQDLHQGIGSLVEGMVHTNLRATQALFHHASPVALIELQQRFAREYLDTLMQGSVAVMRAGRQAADEMLRPLEQRLEQRQRDQRGQQDQGERVADVMKRGVRIASPEDTVQQVARLMREEDTGVLPVGEGDRLVGMVTDRDVTTRLVAEGRDPARTKVREVMTPEVRYVFEDEDLGQVAETMAEQQVRRLPVVNHNKRLVGVVSLGDLAKGRPQLAGRALGGVAQEGGQHVQTAAE
jgi:CBS domain-containing protein